MAISNIGRKLRRRFFCLLGRHQWQKVEAHVWASWVAALWVTARGGQPMRCTHCGRETVYWPSANWESLPVGSAFHIPSVRQL